MSLIRLGVAALFLLLLVPDKVTRGQEKPAATAAGKGPGKLVSFPETTLSPDGKRVAWVEAIPDKDGAPSAHSAIFIADLGAKPGKARRLIMGEEPCTEQAPVW